MGLRTLVPTAALAALIANPASAATATFAPRSSPY
jgi:hypothetical protein